MGYPGSLLGIRNKFYDFMLLIISEANTDSSAIPGSVTK